MPNKVWLFAASLPSRAPPPHPPLPSSSPATPPCVSRMLFVKQQQQPNLCPQCRTIWEKTQIVFLIEF